MRVRSLPLAGLLLWIAAAAPSAQEQITVLATVTDPTTKASVDSVNPADVRLTEDGMPLKVVRVEPVNRVVKVQVLVDNGLGIGADNIADLRQGLRGLLEALPPGVETSVFTTAPQARTLVKPTTDRGALLQGVDRLAPDTGTGRFTESLGEAAERARRDDEDTFTVIVTAGTTSGDGNVQDRDVQRLFERLQGRPVMVHVLLYSGASGRSITGGQLQTEVGLAATKLTGGRYENINTMSRYVTLMPELGAEVAQQTAAQARQFRIVAERAKSGDFGRFGLGVAGKLTTNVSLETQRK